MIQRLIFYNHYRQGNIIKAKEKLRCCYCNNITRADLLKLSTSSHANMITQKIYSEPKTRSNYRRCYHEHSFKDE